MLNPVWLNTFKTLVDTGHFTKTAERLFMTQPGVSQHIKKLEQACGHALLQREKKSFELTEQGRQVYQYAVQLVQNETMLLQQLAFDNPFEGHCRLSCSGSLALLLYPKLLDLQQQHPQLIIELEAAPNQKILADVQSGEVDLGIVTQWPNSGLLSVEELGCEVLSLVLPKSFFNRDKTLVAEPSADTTLARLKKLGLIAHPDAKHYLALYMAQSGEPMFENLSVEEFPISGYVNQLSQILLPVSKGLGFTVLPQSAVANFAFKDQLESFQAQKSVQETLYLVTKRRRELPARFDTLLPCLKQVLGDYQTQIN